jgi:hypothetical protein
MVRCACPICTKPGGVGEYRNGGAAVGAFLGALGAIMFGSRREEVFYGMFLGLLIGAIIGEFLASQHGY